MYLGSKDLAQVYLIQIENKQGKTVKGSSRSASLTGEAGVPGCLSYGSKKYILFFCRCCIYGSLVIPNK